VKHRTAKKWERKKKEWERETINKIAYTYIASCKVIKNLTSLIKNLYISSTKINKYMDFSNLLLYYFDFYLPRAYTNEWKPGQPAITTAYWKKTVSIRYSKVEIRKHNRLFSLSLICFISRYLKNITCL
jgi:hypothetical protein